MTQLRSPLRIALFLLGLAVAAVAIVGRLTQVQIVQGNVFAAAARANQVRRIPVAAPRGLILDRHGVIIARSRPSFVCALIPSEVKDIDATLEELGRHPPGSGEPLARAHLPSPRRQLPQLRRAASLRALRTGDPCNRPDDRADGAPGGGAQRSSRRRPHRAAGAQLSLSQRRLARFRLRRRDHGRRVSFAQAVRLLAERRDRKGRPRVRVRRVLARALRRRADRGELAGRTGPPPGLRRPDTWGQPRAHARLAPADDRRTRARGPGSRSSRRRATAASRAPSSFSIRTPAA